VDERTDFDAVVLGAGEAGTIVASLAVEASGPSTPGARTDARHEPLKTTDGSASTYPGKAHPKARAPTACHGRNHVATSCEVAIEFLNPRRTLSLRTRRADDEEPGGQHMPNQHMPVPRPRGRGSESLIR
jgi:hypothetical protein